MLFVVWSFAIPGVRAQTCTNPVAGENLLPGDIGWDINGLGDPSTQGLATDMSVNVGQTAPSR